MIFFADLDGTFVTTTKDITPASWAALDAVAAEGSVFVPCTGRPFTNVNQELLAHPSVDYVVSANGAAIFDGRTGEALHRVCLGKERAHEIYDIVSGHDDVTFDVFADGAVYVTRENYEKLPEVVPEPYMLKTVLKSRTPLDKTVSQIIDGVDELERISMYCSNPETLRGIWTEVEKVDHLSVVHSYPTNIEIMDADGTKGKALVWVCDRLGIPVEDSVAFGDSLNDISMIEAAGLGVAVANAEDEVRAAADLIAPSNDDDGVAKVIMDCLGGRTGR